MRRRLMLAALVLGLVLLAGRFLATPRKSSPAPAREIVFTREAAPAPYSAAEGPAAELQSLLDLSLIHILRNFLPWKVALIYV